MHVRVDGTVTSAFVLSTDVYGADIFMIVREFVFKRVAVHGEDRTPQGRESTLVLIDMTHRRDDDSWTRAQACCVYMEM